MTRIGWLADQSDHVGGAELTQAEFRAAAPDGVEVVDCLPGKVRKDCDLYVVHNCVQYELKDLRRMEGNPIVKYWHDVGPWLKPGVGEWLRDTATHMCCSPAQAKYMQLQAACIPPPVDLARFEAAADAVNGSRAGVVSVGSWRNYGKAPHKVAEWARKTGTPVKFYGGGAFAPDGSLQVAYQDMPALLAGHQAFVFLPAVIEPFGRLVAEAWAAGCEIVTNDLVGAKYWITKAPEKLETASEDFWKVVLA